MKLGVEIRFAAFMDDVAVKHGPKAKVHGFHRPGHPLTKQCGDLEMRKCCYCGSKDKELRPYGPKGADVCFECAMESPDRQREARIMFANQLDACRDVAVIGSDVGPYPYFPYLASAERRQG